MAKDDAKKKMAGEDQKKKPSLHIVMTNGVDGAHQKDFKELGLPIDAFVRAALWLSETGHIPEKGRLALAESLVLRCKNMGEGNLLERACKLAANWSVKSVKL